MQMMLSELLMAEQYVGEEFVLNCPAMVEMEDEGVEAEPLDLVVVGTTVVVMRSAINVASAATLPGTVVVLVEQGLGRVHPGAVVHIHALPLGVAPDPRTLAPQPQDDLPPPDAVTADLIPGLDPVVQAVRQLLTLGQLRLCIGSIVTC